MMYNKKFFNWDNLSVIRTVISIVIFIVILIVSPSISYAATALTDDFTGTTIDPAKWTEYDTGGTGGTVGNVQQNGVLTITGDGTWNHEGLKSVQTFDRSKGDITVEGDWQLKNSCASGGPSVAIMYGDWTNGSQQSGTLSLIYFSGQFGLYNASTVVNLTTQITCALNTTIHYKFIVRQIGGVDVYLNGSVNPNGSLSIAEAPNTYTNKPILLQQRDATINPVITIDNLVVTTSDMPATPTGLASTPSSGQVTLNWTAPSSIGSALTDYKVEYKLSSEPTVWTVFGDGVSTSTSAIVDGIFNGVSYDFRVSGTNGIGTSSPSSAISSIPNLYAPSAPYGLVASFGPNNHIGLSWTIPLSNGGSSITDYLVEYKLTTEPTVWTTFVDGVSSAPSATVTGLYSNNNYDFRVSAINSTGTSLVSSTVTKKAGAYLLYDDFTGTTIDTNKWIEYDSATSGSGGTAGKVQQNGSLSLVGSSAWNTNALKSVQTFDRSIGDIIIETDWTINNCAASGNVGAISYGDWVTNGTMVSGTLVFQFAQVVFKLFYWPSGNSSAVSCTNGVPIHIKAVIKQAGGMDVYLNNSGTATLSLTAGNAPSSFNNKPVVLQQYDTTNSFFDNLTVSNLGYTIPSKTIGLTATPRDSQMELTWTAPANGGSAITDYLVQYKLSSEPTVWTTFAHTSSSSATNFVTGLTNAISYDFKVSAVNINGTGTASDVVTSIPIQSTPSAPQNLSAGNTVSNQIDLTWSTPVSNGGASITDYLVEYKLTSEPTVWTTFTHGASTSTSISVTSLTNGLRYDFRVSAINSNGTGAHSSVVTKSTVNSTPLAPVASSVSITGQSHVSEYLLGSYVYSDPNADPEGVTTFRWLNSSSIGGTYLPISGATNINYTVDATDLNKYLKLEVTPVSTITPFTGTPVLSIAIGPITAANYIYHILSTGQSLSLGYAGSPVLSTTQPYSNKMLDGTDSSPGANFSPLVEATNETPAAATGNGITFQNGVQTVVTRSAIGGTAYSGLKKGTEPYANAMQQIVNVRNAATLLGQTSQVLGITTIHGETDNSTGTSAATYEADLVEWQHDYETDIKAINGQIGTIPLFTDQMDSWTTYGYTTSVIPQAQLAASEDYPGKVILVGPKYFLNYSGTGPHLTNTSYRLLGEYYAKVMKKVFFDKVAWRPLSPDATQRIGNVIYAKFHVPAGVLALDTTLVSQNTNYGFEYYDATSSATISSVSILNSDTVKITLSNVPSGSNQRLRYAYNGTINSAAGAQPAGSPRGNLRDTDTAVSLSGSNLYNWAVHFDKAITEVTDTIPPTVTVFTIPTTNPSLTVPINSFTGTDDYFITGYLINESSSVPSAGDSGWSGTAPTSYVFSNQGSKTLYAWAKDGAGNISTSMNAPVTVSLSATTFTFTGPTSGNVNSASTNFTVIPNNSYTGTITLTPTGAGSSGLSATVLTFSSATAQTFTITPTTGGSITLTPTNNDSLTNPSNIIYTANAVVPGAPTSVVATPLNHGASVTFVAPASNGGSAITGYTVTSSSGGTDSNAGSTSLTHTVTGLTNGTSYTFTVKATNSIGEGSASSASNAVTPADTNVPTVTAFTIPSTSSSLSVSISSFTATDNTAVTGYLINESSSVPSAGDSGWSGTAPTSYVFSNQGSKTLYAWAKDGAGNISTSMNAPVTVSLSATTFTFTGPTSGNVNSASTNFTVIPNNSYTGTITLTPTGAGSSGLSATVLTFSSATAQTFTITPTNGGSITLTPTNNGGLSNPSNITYIANAIAPGAPTSVVATPLNFSASVTFAAPASNGGSTITGYTVTSIPAGGTDSNTGTTSLTHTVTGLTNGTSYAFTVKATNLIGEGPASSSSNSITPTDLTLPIVTSFTIPSTSTSLTVSVSSFTATDNNAVTGYLLTESSSSPLSSDGGWSGTAPTSYTFTSQGAKTLYAWVKDAAGNVSASMSGSVTVDTASPTVTAFTIPSTASSLTVSISSFTATDTVGVTGYLITESSNTPLSNDGGWSGTAPTSYTFTSQGAKTLYAWVKDAAGNVSASMSGTVSIDTIPVITNIVSTPSSGGVSISWVTDDLSSSRVDYGFNNNYGTSTTEVDTSPRVTNHIVALSGLTSCTTYYYSMYSKNGSDLSAQSQDKMFTTSGCTGGASVLNQSSSSITIASGGNVELFTNSQGINVNIPINFGSSDANFQIKKLDKNETVTSTSVPVGYLTIGSYVYDLKALSGSGAPVTTFDNSLTVSMTYTADDIVGKSESSLKIYRWDGVIWNSLSNCIVDVTLKKVTCDATHFSVFGLFGQLAPVSSVIVTSSNGGGGGGGGASFGCADKTATNYTPFVVNISSLCKYPKVDSVIEKNKEEKISIEVSVPKDSIYKFTRDLKLGMTGVDVKKLQQYLNDKGFLVAKSGVGSKGKENTKFGPATKAALIRFQKAKGIKPTSGIFGPITRWVVNK